MRESTAERKFRAEATARLFLVLKVGRQGYPDQLVSWGDGHCWLEWKTPTGRLTKAQRRRFPEMRKQEERVEVVTSTAAAWRAVLQFYEGSET